MAYPVPAEGGEVAARRSLTGLPVKVGGVGGGVGGRYWEGGRVRVFACRFHRLLNNYLGYLRVSHVIPPRPPYFPATPLLTKLIIMMRWRRTRMIYTCMLFDHGLATGCIGNRDPLPPSQDFQCRLTDAAKKCPRRAVPR